MFRLADEIDLEKYLYYYTSFETGAKYILPKMRLRFNSFKNTNDPRETKEWNFNLSISEGEHEKLPICVDFLSYQKKFTDLIKKRIKLLCFSRDYNPQNGEWKNYGLFGRGFMKPRMWAQYGDNHKGLCLIIDKKMFESELLAEEQIIGKYKSDYIEYRDYFEPNDLYAFKIDTKDIIKSNFKDVVNDRVKRYYKTMFFRKNIDWETETEYRYLLKNNIKNVYIDIKNCLKGVVLGLDFVLKKKRVIKKLLPNSITIAQLYYINQNYTVGPID